MGWCSKVLLGFVVVVKGQDLLASFNQCHRLISKRMWSVASNLIVKTFAVKPLELTISDMSRIER